MYRYLYQSLCMQIHDHGPSIMHIDLWNNQISRSKEDYPYQLPAAFIEFRPVTWVTGTDGRRKADMLIDIHLETSRTGMSGDNETWGTDQDRALEYLSTLESLYTCLMGHHNGGDRYSHSMLMSVADRLDVNDGVTREDILTFQCHVIDDNARIAYLTLQRQMKLDVAIKKD